MPPPPPLCLWKSIAEDQTCENLQQNLISSVSWFAAESPPNHSFTFRSRKALAMTETELRLIAAPAMIGLRSTPKNG